MAALTYSPGHVLRHDREIMYDGNVHTVSSGHTAINLNPQEKIPMTLTADCGSHQVPHIDYF